MSGTMKIPDVDGAGWTCASCGEPLVLRPTELAYLNSQFNVELPTCPKCGYVLIPEDLALDRMRRAEQLLEDK